MIDKLVQLINTQVSIPLWWFLWAAGALGYDALSALKAFIT